MARDPEVHQLRAQFKRAEQEFDMILYSKTEVRLTKQPRLQSADNTLFTRFRNLCYLNRILNGW